MTEIDEKTIVEDDIEAVSEQELPVDFAQEKDLAPEVEKEQASFGERWKNAKKPEPLYYVKEVISYILIFILAVAVGLLINIYIVRLSRVQGDSMVPTLHNNQMLGASRLPVIFNDINHGDIVIFDHTKEARSFGKDLKEALSDNMITALFGKSKSAENHTYYIKRVIAVEGEVIAVYENKLYRTTLKNIGCEDYLDVYDAYNKENSAANNAALDTAYYKIKSITPDSTWELLEESYVNPAEEADYKNYEGKCWVCGRNEIFVMGDNRNNSTDSRRIGVINLNCILGKVLGKH
ncbi:MAG: signal peptidase I [Clostridia bacterium]|nr:signal peptidase I [Clostridia bacterium]